MRQSLRAGSIVIASFGLLVLTSAVGAISITDRIQPSARTAEPVVAVALPTPAQPTAGEREQLQPRSLGYLVFDWDAANPVPGFDAQQPSAVVLADRTEQR
jgi:hypothetical protein